MIIVNADDWGRSVEETDVALECFRLGRISSVTAMVFMADSERAASIAIKEKVPTGLHINFSQSFTGAGCPPEIETQHNRIVRFIRSSRLAQLVYNPLLRKAFRTVYETQLKEFRRLYGREPSHFDGHQHMHLCANMLVALPIPRGSKVRRTFSFGPGDKSWVNRTYRTLISRRLRRNYRVVDHFFALSQQLAEPRFKRVCDLARNSEVELMTHPIVQEERSFLTSPGFGESLEALEKGSYLALRPR
jgi:predicted glycoside hydrolase/deacetylase ChbG (UPF0249 family)